MNGPRRHITPEDEARIKAAAIELRANGHSWTSIRKKLGVGIEWIRRRIVPGYAETSNRKSQERLHRDGESNRVAGRWRRELESHQRAQPRPEDTRNFTQRFLGDPLPGRSALDAKTRPPPECRDCKHYLHTPFTCGFCIRKSKHERCTDERAWRGSDNSSCGPRAVHFIARERSVA